MAIRHTVRRGDTLWGLACQYLGSGARWPEIYDAHNQAVARTGSSSLFFPIANENLIFVGQQILIPPRTKSVSPGSGSKAEGGKGAIPVSLKVTYGIGRETPPKIWVQPYGDFTITTQLTGEIGVEIFSMDRYRHSLELAMSRDNPTQAKQKLYDAYDPAVNALTAKPEMVYESGKVKINAPIAAKANIGLYEVMVQNVTPMHMSGSIKPQTITGTLKAGPCSYNYSADIEFKVDVVWHQRPNARPEPVAESIKERLPQTQKPDAIEPSSHITKWDKTVAEKGYVIAVVSITLYAAYKLAGLLTAGRGTMTTTTMPPFIHNTGYRNDHREA